MTELDRFNLDPAVRAQLSALMSSLVQQNNAQLAEKNSLLEQSAKIIAEKDTKIAALPHELAYYKRIRFGQKSEALADLQRDLFQEGVETDLAAIEAELASLKAAPRTTVAVPRSPRTGRQPVTRASTAD